MPPVLENFGLKAALTELCDNFRNTGAIELFFEAVQHDDGPKPEKTAELNLFRVVQELLNNSLRHGQARNIVIRLSMNPLEINLDYQDDGRGVDLNGDDFRPGLGLQNIESRMKMIGASHQLASTPGAGFRATILYPYPS